MKKRNIEYQDETLELKSKVSSLYKKKQPKDGFTTSFVISDSKVSAGRDDILENDQKLTSPIAILSNHPSSIRAKEHLESKFEDTFATALNQTSSPTCKNLMTMTLNNQKAKALD
mgnify:CR=1 FL=1